jgi:hypothetical protein
MEHVGFGEPILGMKKMMVDWEQMISLTDHHQYKRLWQTPTGYMFRLDM